MRSRLHGGVCITMPICMLAIACGGTEPRPAAQPAAATPRPSAFASDQRQAARIATPARGTAPESVPAALSPRDRDEAQYYVAELEHIASHFTAHAGDCTELAAAFEAASVHREELMRRVSGRTHELAIAERDLRLRLDAATQTIVDGSMRCANDERFVLARERLLARPRP